MTRGIPTLVMIVLASVDLCRSDPTRAAVFQADGNSETAFEYTQTLQHVHSGMSCAVFCTETRDVCKAWTYDIGEHICHIQTGLVSWRELAWVGAASWRGLELRVGVGWSCELAWVRAVSWRVLEL